MASLSSSSSSSSSSSQRSRKKMKRRSQSHGPDQPIEWRSSGQQQFYSSKLLKALRHVRLDGSPSSGPRRVHEAADRVLAAIAKGRSRWSRAILSRRLKVKHLRKKNNIAAKRESKITTVVTGNRNSRSRKLNGVLRLKKKSLPAVLRKVKVLGRLVPGCRKQPLPVVLEEATDYIAALEMQVKAMSALAERLSLYSSSPSGCTGLSEPRSSLNSHT